MEIKLKDTCSPLHICRQGLPSFILISNKPHCWAIKKGSLWNKLAWWPLPASSIPMPPLSPPPTTTTPHSSSPYLIFLEISLVFTHGITPARVNHNKCFIKKCILMFRAMHGSCWYSYTRLSWWCWCICHPSFLTIRSTSNDCEVSCCLFSPTSHLSTNFQKNP